MPYHDHPPSQHSAQEQLESLLGYRSDLHPSLEYEAEFKASHQLDPIRIERLELRHIVPALKLTVATRLRFTNRSTSETRDFLVFGRLMNGARIRAAGTDFEPNTEYFIKGSALAMPGTSYLIFGHDNVVTPALELAVS